MIKTLSSNRNIYFHGTDASCTSVLAYMKATLLVRLTPLCAKDDDRAPVRRANWKPMPKVFGVTFIKCSLAWLEITEAVNAVGVAYRTVQEVRDKWKNLTSTAKKEFSDFGKLTKESR